MGGILPLIVQLVLGAIGGVGTAQVVKQVDLGMVWNIVAGAIGGVIGTWIAAYIPGLGGMIGAGGDMSATGALIGQAVTGLIGGGILTAIAGYIRKSMGGGN